VESGTPALVQATITDRNPNRLMIAAARYRVTNTSGEIIPWTNMTPAGGRYILSSQGVTASIPTYSLKGSYTVEVKGMSSGYKTDLVSHTIHLMVIGAVSARRLYQLLK